MAQYKARDPQNPYRTGCLVGNYVEDKFGAELAVQEVSITPKNFPIIEEQFCNSL